MDRASVLAAAVLLFADEAMAQADGGGLSGVSIGLIVAAIVIVFIAISVAGICCFNYKRKHLGRLEFEHPEFERSSDPYFRASTVSHDPVPAPVQYDGSNDKTVPYGPSSDSDGDAVSIDDIVTSPGKAGRKERFEEQLMELQPHVDTFQEMLTDVQERVKTAKHGNPRVHGYKAVSRDLSRVQHLLNKRNSAALKMPPDGNELLAWATETRENYLELQRYKSRKDSGATDPPEMASIMWIQSKDDSAFEDKSYDESAII